MTLLERYLDTVRRRLPQRERDDIVAELRDAISTQIDAESAERGRPLTEDEVAAILKRFGRPTTVAARYGARDSLIGPNLYPAYLISLKIMAWIFVPLAGLSVLLAAMTADNVTRQVIQKAFLAIVMVLVNVAIVTMLFAWIDRRTRWEKTDDWDPHSLPEPFAPPGPTPRPEAVCGIGLMTFYLLVWTGVLPVNAWIFAANRWFGGSPLPYGFAPVWAAVNSLIIVLMLTSIARDVASLLQPHRVMLRAAVGVALHAGALVALIQLLRADALFVVTDPALPGAGHVGSFNLLFRTVFFVAAMGVAASGAFALRRLLRMVRERRHRGMMPATS
jgi:hypothetical protein